MGRKVIVCVLLLGGVLLLAPATAGAQTFRVLTYNVQGLPVLPPPFFNIDSNYGRGSFARGADIGSRAAAAGYDVLAFNEVFTDAMRDGLLAGLPASRFPTRTPIVGSGRLQDSGLLLVSRFAPLAMAIPSGSSDECVVPTSSGCTFAFHEYDACTSAGSPELVGDCESAKGVGLVRLANTVTGRPLDVLFTHMQADYASTLATTRATRVAQYAEVRAFMRRWIPLAGSVGRDALFLGDLNTPDDDFEHGQPSPEWHSELGPRSPLGAGLGFRDIWRFEHSRNDPGYTQDPRNSQQGDHKRVKLDYILLRRAAAGATCADHQRIPFRVFRDNERADLSDHWAVEATFAARRGRNCSPNRAQRISSGTVRHARPLNRGGSLWYRIDTPGTWKVLSSSRRTTVQAFAANDLTTPITPSGRRNVDVHVGRSPVYVRVVPTSPAARPRTGVFFSPRNGARPSSAIHLPTGRRATVLFGQDLQNPDNPVNNAARYFRIRARALTSGRRQTIRIRARGIRGDNPNVRLRLLDGGKEIATSGGFAKGTTLLTTRLPARGGDFIVELSGDVGYVAVRYLTNLRSVRLLRVRCNETEDVHPDDSIRLRIKSDLRATKEFHLGFFNNGRARSLQTRYGDGGLVNYVRRVDVRMIELDPGDPEGHDDLGARTITTAPKPVFLMKFDEDEADYDLFVESVPLP